MPRVPLVAFLIASAAILSGCVTEFDRNRETLRQMHEQGQYQMAAAVLDDPKSRNLYDGRNELLYWLDRGAIAQALGDDALTIDLLSKAEDWMEVKREPNAGDEFGRWLINDTITPYYGSPYEDMYANVLKLLAQLEAGRISGGATVEARRLAGKADWLRDRYVRTRDQVVQRGDQQYKEALARTTSLVDVNEEGQFIESTLGTYLTALTFMKDGERSMQEVAGRRLESSIALQKSMQVGVNPERFKNIGALQASEVNLLVVGLSGRAPHKVAQRIGPIPVYEWPVYFELPELTGGSMEVGAVRVRAVPLAGGEDLYGELDFVEDLGAVAKENQKRELPLIYARTLLRSQAKAAAWFAATQAAKNSSKGSTQDAIQIGMILGGLAFMAATEKADLRSWTFLPGRADAGVFKLAPGRYRVEMEFLSHSGGVMYAPPAREIEITGNNNDRELVTVVEVFWK